MYLKALAISAPLCCTSSIPAQHLLMLLAHNLGWCKATKLIGEQIANIKNVNYYFGQIVKCFSTIGDNVVFQNVLLFDGIYTYINKQKNK